MEVVALGLGTRGAAVKLALAVADDADALDRQIEDVAENWRLERIGIVERNVLRLALHELKNPDLPAPIAINEAVKLARWFAGPKAPGFVNGVLDTLARRLGRL
jgi:N utilization substance protein B